MFHTNRNLKFLRAVTLLTFLHSENTSESRYALSNERSITAETPKNTEELEWQCACGGQQAYGEEAESGVSSMLFLVWVSPPCSNRSIWMSSQKKSKKKYRLKPKQPGVLKRLFFMLTDQSQDPTIPSTCQTTECFPAQILCSFTLSVWDTSNLCWLIKSWMRWAQRGRLTCWLLCVVLYPPVCMFSCCLAHSWNWHNRLLACNGQWDFSTKCIFEHGHNSQF